jgi:hypothetical protein
MIASASADVAMPLDYDDPNGCFPSLCFTPYDKASGRPYPHCIWCTHAERDAVIAGKANLRAGINAVVGNQINFNLKVGRACSNPMKPDGGPANPGLPGCPTGQRRCGNGCIPVANGDTVCCDLGDNRTSAYCDNAAGGAREGACFPLAGCGSEFCCASNGSFSSNDCPTGQHHCGLLCYSLDHPCCPTGSTDPQCNRGGALAGPPRAVGVTPPAAPTGGGGGDCNYAGTWSGRFSYTCNDNPMRTDVNGSIGVKLVLTQLAPVVNGMSILSVTSVQTDDAAFGFTSTSQVATNIAELPCTNPSQSGSGIIVMFPNGSTIGTTNQANALTVTNSGRTIENSADPAFTGMTWTGSTVVGDSNSPGSGPGGHVYNSCKFTSWVLNLQ